jgi:hypothetical protein
VGCWAVGGGRWAVGGNSDFSLLCWLAKDPRAKGGSRLRHHVRHVGAVKEGGLNRIRDALARRKDFHGVTGMISFDHRGNDMRGVDFAVVHDGKFLPLRMAGEHVRKGAHE